MNAGAATAAPAAARLRRKNRRREIPLEGPVPDLVVLFLVPLMIRCCSLPYIRELRRIQAEFKKPTSSGIVVAWRHQQQV